MEKGPGRKDGVKERTSQCKATLRRGITGTKIRDTLPAFWSMQPSLPHVLLPSLDYPRATVCLFPASTPGVSTM